MTPKKYYMKKKLIATYIVHEVVYADDDDEARMKSETYFDAMDLKAIWDRPVELEAKDAEIEARE